jgi:hypothetical protein
MLEMKIAASLVDVCVVDDGRLDREIHDLRIMRKLYFPYSFTTCRSLMNAVCSLPKSI